uniref:aromatic ring-hydroxylating oxygenase subunit alpha n=1 Tax=Ningiella ruwaisensis TaxID=2364274 RepID=UPI00109EFB83|nr:SRPBCC family protein [Ningiella ruwaisensis]
MNHPSIKSYFDSSICQAEIDSMFSKGLSYAGHQLMVPDKYAYQVLPYQHDRYVLFNQGEHFELISNVCLHRQAKLLEGSGRARNIVCKVHCWGYDHLGTLKGAPQFKPQPQGQLDKTPLNAWNGLLFKGRTPNFDLAEHGLDTYINFDEYFYAGCESAQYNFNWKTFVEIYLENYHVSSMHPGLRHYVTPDELEWAFGDDFSVQKVGLGKNLQKPTTPYYREFQDALVKRFGDALPKYGAIWCFIYPNIMIEWYPDVLVISTIFPKGPRQCVNHVEFYYPSALYQASPDYFASEKQAYMETAAEDEQACLLLEQGREALYLSAEEAHGPIEGFLEAGVSHFYAFLAKQS